MKSSEDVTILLAQLAQLQVVLIHTDVVMTNLQYKLKELRHEIRHTVDGDPLHEGEAK
jgi:hypothetical protein